MENAETLEIQEERLEAQQARLTVAFASERLEKAKKAAARRISRRNSIRGFRKGKAPYAIVLRNFGEAAILDEALGSLGNEIYREALSQSQLPAYGPGTLEDFSLQPQPQLTFILPLQPEVELNNYRDQRLEYEEPQISDEDMARQMKSLRFQHAVFEESRAAVASGDRVTLDYHMTFADGPEHAPSAGEMDTESGEAEDIPLRGSDFSRGDEREFWLEEGEEPLLPGFRAALLGSEIDEEREFDLAIPDETNYRQDIIGRLVHCRAKIRKIENVTLPEMNDAFAANLTREEETPLTLLQLRQRIRENMQQQADEQQRAAYANEVQEKMRAQADIRFPEEMLADETEARLQHFASDLQQRYHLNLADYQRIQGTTDEEMREEFRPEARRGLEAWLLRDAIRVAEGISVTADMASAEAQRLLDELGEQASDELRAQYQSDETQNRIANHLLQRQIDERICEIGRGIAPELSANLEAVATEGDSEG